MKTKLLGIALFGFTLATIVYYPQLSAKNMPADVPPPIAVEDAAKIDLVFVLDTTSSMSGLIQAAKEKIWSIATTMASAQQTPQIRIGLVAYRDRGDAYVTRIVDLSDDLDSVYAALMDFEAEGGGDTPESVNAALNDAVHKMSWSQQEQAYQVIFLVGDAPPHMDYNETRYPSIVAAALAKGILVNTIQCGDMPSAIDPWTQIASLGHGRFFKVAQAGNAVAYDTPFDEKIAELSAKLDGTRLYYGTEEEKRKMGTKVAATDKLNAGASIASRARRGVFNASASGSVNLLGENELVDAVVSGDVDLADLDKDALPAALSPMAADEQRLYIAKLADERASFQRQIRELSQSRGNYLASKVEEAGGLEGSLDQQLYDTVKEQALSFGLEYEDGPAY